MKYEKSPIHARLSAMNGRFLVIVLPEARLGMTDSDGEDFLFFGGKHLVDLLHDFIMNLLDFGFSILRHVSRGGRRAATPLC